MKFNIYSTRYTLAAHEPSWFENTRTRIVRSFHLHTRSDGYDAPNRIQDTQDDLQPWQSIRITKTKPYAQHETARLCSVLRTQKAPLSVFRLCITTLRPVIQQHYATVIRSTEPTLGIEYRTSCVVPTKPSGGSSRCVQMVIKANGIIYLPSLKSQLRYYRTTHQNIISRKKQYVISIPPLLFYVRAHAHAPKEPIKIAT